VPKLLLQHDKMWRDRASRVYSPLLHNPLIVIYRCTKPKLPAKLLNVIIMPCIHIILKRYPMIIIWAVFKQIPKQSNLHQLRRALNHPGTVLAGCNQESLGNSLTHVSIRQENPLTVTFSTTVRILKSAFPPISSILNATNTVGSR
jgi:hypothetical protein